MLQVPDELLFIVVYLSIYGLDSYGLLFIVVYLYSYGPYSCGLLFIVVYLCSYGLYSYGLLFIVARRACVWTCTRVYVHRHAYGLPETGL